MQPHIPVILNKIYLFSIPLSILLTLSEGLCADGEKELLPSIANQPSKTELSIYGYIEYVLLGPSQIRLKAKLDSGAKMSSIKAVDLVEFERDGKKWVRFFVLDPSSGNPVQFEKEIRRYIKIKQHSGPSDKRPVILVEAKLGNNHIQREFNLASRKDFIYQVLLGRNFLNGIGLIDVSRKFLAKSASSHLDK